ncbi:MAG: hypothetical protein V4663_06670 [Bacteroidota bacterium]
MKTTRLTFSQLHQEMEVLELWNLRGIKGGYQQPDIGWVTQWLSEQLGMSVSSSRNDQGDWMVSINGSAPARLVFSLDEVTIVGSRNLARPNQFQYTEDAFGASWAYVGDSSGGGGTGGGTGGGSGGNTTPLTQRPWYIAISNMLSSMDLSVSGASLSAHLMGIQMPAGFVYSGHILTATSIIDNTVQLSEGFNWNDASQLGVGGVLIGTAFIASAPVSVPVVFIGGLGLFFWEVFEAPIE